MIAFLVFLILLVIVTCCVCIRVMSLSQVSKGMSNVIEQLDVLCLSRVEGLQNRLGNEIYSVRKAPSLIGSTREFIESVPEVLDHCVVVGRVVASDTKYLQRTIQRSEL